MNATQGSVNADKLILNLRRNLLNHDSHLDCSPFIDLHLDLLPDFELIKYLFEVVGHRFISIGILSEKFI